MAGLPIDRVSRLPTDRVALDEYMGVWFRSKVSEAVEVRSMGISFRTELDQDDDVSLLGLLDTFVHMMYEIVRKREKDVRELDY
ncbi:hypothetical protein Tco_0500849 [Tanacetum coccineum]